MGKVSLLELCKKLKFDHTNKSYMPNPESVLENETHKLLWNFEIQTDHLISAGQPDLVIVNKIKGTCRIVDFAVQRDHRVKKKWKRKYLDLAREQKKSMEHKGDSNTICNWHTWNKPQRIDKRTGRFGNKRTNRGHPDYSILKIGLNTEKSLDDKRILAVTQTAVKHHQLTLAWKARKEVKSNNNKFSGILEYKQIAETWQENQTEWK